MNPFEEKGITIDKSYESLCAMYPRPYDEEVSPYSKTRVILMNGTEFDANWFSHQFARHITDNDLKRDVALCREAEKQQQLKLSLLKPIGESVLAHTIGYEQLAVDLTAELAKRVDNVNIKNSLDFALLEDFDHLYRYADLMEMREGVKAENLVGKYTEIMPGRPTVAHHRCPSDNVKKGIISKKSSTMDVLATLIITGAEQQTMNYYMNIATFSGDDLARRLYQEIALVEEEHVTQYESLQDAGATWLEMMLWHEYAECYLYWSCYKTESDKYLKDLWEKNLMMELGHLHKASDLLKKYQRKDWQEVILDPVFPEPLSLHENKDYVRDILANTVQYTNDKENYALLSSLDKDADFYTFQSVINADIDCAPSHEVINTYISLKGEDYRYQEGKHPIGELDSRTEDNVEVGRVANATREKKFFKNV
ncbi:MAG: hypothetical protein IKD20_05760 [Clostridia bacterium]|nr:hypothetical protein [Clostridia bacterium]